MSIVPVDIHPHLVAYFFKEMEAEETVYMGRKVRATKIPLSSSLGRTMRMAMVSIGHPVKPEEHFQLYLSVEDNPEEGKHYHGTYYKFESGSRHWLGVPDDVCKDFNLLLEDIFRTNFSSFMDGYLQDKRINNGSNFINQGINIWIDKYDLLEVGFSTESFRQLYYREKKKAG